MRLVELASGLIRDSRIPLFSSKIFKKDLYPTPVTPFSPSSKNAWLKITGTW
jgi:hypothetical protein